MPLDPRVEPAWCWKNTPPGRPSGLEFPISPVPLAC